MNEAVPRIRISTHVAQEAYALAAIRNGQLARGPHIEQLEGELKQRFGRRHAVLTTNGFAALFAVLRALGRPASEPIRTVAASTCFAMANAIKAAGYTVEFMDLEPETMSMGDAGGASVDTGRVHIVPHHFGRVAALLEQRRNPEDLFIEDAAQAFISRMRVRTTSHSLILSFYPTKWVSGIDGGAILTDDTEMFKVVKRMISYVDQVNEEPLPRFNLGMSNLHAAYALGTLKVLGEITERLQERFATLTDIAIRNGLKVHVHAPGEVPSRFIITCEEMATRDCLLDILNARGISASRELIWLCADDVRSRFPVAADLIGRTLSLPFHPYLTQAEMNSIDQALEAACC
jgi:dTDP-4-amino-4,6-dideoxygalactose transaminase